MIDLQSTVFRVLAMLLLCLVARASYAEEARTISVVERPGAVEIRIGEDVFATYVYRDGKTLRPYFANVHAPNGVQVTRNHPPKAGVDPTDHAEMHPGIWLAFGDVSGADFWRNKGRVEHIEFVEKPTASDGNLTFTVSNQYVNGDKTICNEVCRHAVLVRPAGILLTYDSAFRADELFAFGDQEEMGLGVRVASPLRVKGGNGLMLASDGNQNEAQVRGSTPEWVDYSGEVDGQRVGVMLIPDPRNFRPSWFHARDYGLIVANPFGRNALTGEATSAVIVKPMKTFHLRFAVLVHSSPDDKPVDLKAAYADYLEQTKQPPHAE